MFKFTSWCGIFHSITSPALRTNWFSMSPNCGPVHQQLPPGGYRGLILSAPSLGDSCNIGDIYNCNKYRHKRHIPIRHLLHICCCFVKGSCPCIHIPHRRGISCGYCVLCPSWLERYPIRLKWSHVRITPLSAANHYTLLFSHIHTPSTFPSFVSSALNKLGVVQNTVKTHF